MPTTIEDLPREVLLHILDLRTSHLWIWPRYSTLSQLSLVSRSFRVPAQALLSRSIFIKRMHTATSLIESGGGDLVTEEVSLAGNWGLGESLGLVGGVVDKCRGMRTLKLDSFFSPFPVEMLMSPALSNLTSLDLQNVLDVHYPYTSASLHLPFQLTHLRLHNLGHFSLHLLTAILASPSLTHVTFSIHPASVQLDQDLSHHFDLAKSVTHFTTTRVPPDLAEQTRLQHLSLIYTPDHDFVPALETLKGKLKVLEVPGLGSMEVMMEALALPALDRLEELELASEEWVKTLPGWMEFMRLMEKRKIRLRYKHLPER
ncbi:hypothetical protein MNV49_005876 [Pseudohyphozyma bogoriensis]|nr:hypothetical protein MNV49_005876 [Pseudohyphozyma bogoriensis]